MYNGKFYWTFPNKTESGTSSVLGKLKVMRSDHVGLKKVAVAAEDWDNKAKKK